MTQKFSDGASINVLAVSSASIAPVGLYALPDSDVFPTRAVAGDVRGGSSTRSSPSSSPSLGPATPPFARSAFDFFLTHKSAPFIDLMNFNKGRVLLAIIGRLRHIVLYNDTTVRVSKLVYESSLPLLSCPWTVSVAAAAAAAAIYTTRTSGTSATQRMAAACLASKRCAVARDWHWGPGRVEENTHGKWNGVWHVWGDKRTQKAALLRS